MDHRKFDRLTQRLGAAGSRRQAMRAVFGAALVGATTTHAAAIVRQAPTGRGHKICVDENCSFPPGREGGVKGRCCPGNFCSCGEKQECCNNRCFWDNQTNPTKEFCCAGPEWVICGEGQDAKCCPNVGQNSCLCVGSSVITGTYRRR
jgi:hypothetical protein